MDWPTLSIVMPVRNEEATLEESLGSILAQDYPRPFEVIAAEGASADGSRAMLERIAAADPRVAIVENPSGHTPSGLNAAIRRSTGEVIVRCDGHVRFPEGYVRRAVELLMETGADNVGGIQAAEGATTMQRAIALGMSIKIGVGDARFRTGGPPGEVDTVFLGTFRRAALERVGYFDERLLRNQDSELNYRIRASGGRVYFHPDLRVTYRPRASLGALWRQYWGSGAWKRRTFRKSWRALRPRQAAPVALVLGLVASAGLAFTPLRGAALALPVVYAGVLLLSATGLALARRAPAAFLLPVVLPVMHVGWGAGFLFGRARATR
ncbi:MAG TPA: glycosyltransferase family 2 protein [Actinomycetota bacterium]